ncbi:MAG TPA: hypoxanthine/guanine phosphoribosyltransferase [Methanomassiliicoccales archaeon]|nr:hypoxanthine/guanine phosphoribosyltransferase [Methanomassiliicoccales archaeon]
MTLELLKADLQRSPIVRMGDYQYFISPVTDGIPLMRPEILDEVLAEMARVGDFNCDLICAPEAMGLPLAAGLSLRLGIPYNVIRKRKYGLPGEVSVHQVTGYSEKEFYLNGVRKGDRVTLVDDVLSTGGTIRAILSAIRSVGAVLVDVVIVVEKGESKGRIEKELGVKVKTLVKVDVKDGRLRILS